VFVVDEADEADLTPLLQQVVQQKLPLKTILQIVGQSQDEMPRASLASADLVLLPDLPQPILLEKLKAILSAGRLPPP